MNSPDLFTVALLCLGLVVAVFAWFLLNGNPRE